MEFAQHHVQWHNVVLVMLNFMVLIAIYSKAVV